MDLEYRLKEIEIDLGSRFESRDAIERLCIILRSIRPSCSGETKKSIEAFLEKPTSLDKAKEMCYTALDALENKKKDDDEDYDV